MWTSTVNHAATRNKQRMENAGFSTEHFAPIAGVEEIEDKLPGVILPKDIQVKIARVKAPKFYDTVQLEDGKIKPIPLPDKHAFDKEK
jgi:hypothetical protein